uniref:thiol oxidase n=1 Tax=viral metagenome TaxID=1070528 RepID=A0A6C0BN35_9ZZZZ
MPNALSGLDIRVWGPALWKTLHTISFTYPKQPSAEDKHWYRTFYESLAHVLPCVKCRSHWAQLLRDFPIRLDSRQALSEWVVEAHNQVNERSKKPRKEYAEVLEEYRPPTQAQAPMTRSTGRPLYPWLMPLSVLIVLALTIYIIVHLTSRSSS